MSNPWAEKMARIRSAEPAQVAVNLNTDPSTLEALGNAEHGLTVARTAAARRFRESVDDPNALTLRAEVDAAVDADPDVIAANTVRDAAQADADEATIEFWLRALPRDVYSKTADAHPPTPDQAEKGKTVNEATFVPAIVSACHVDRQKTGIGPRGQILYRDHPGMTLDDAFEIFGNPTTGSPALFSQGDCATLYAAAVAVNETSRVDFGALGKGSGLTPR